MKNKIIKIVALTSSIISLVLSIVLILLVFVFKEKSPNEIYTQSIESIVEVKASEEEYASYGTGVFIDTEGHFVTNAHVIKRDISGVPTILSSIEVRFSYGDEYRKASLIKHDFDLDLAYLVLDEMEGIQVKPLHINSSKVSSGDTIYAIGNGMNHGLGITKGIVSLPLVNIEYGNAMHSVIQCDIIINNGNSGGPLIDSNGSLIGITSFRLKEVLGNPMYGIAYAIPSNVLLEYIND